jgi:hypothetical protein
MKLHPCCLALAGGILSGLVVALMTLMAVCCGLDADMMKMWATYHPGYEVSYAGMLVGFIYGFVEAFVWLYLFGHLYNFFTKRCCKSHCEKAE